MEKQCVILEYGRQVEWLDIDRKIERAELDDILAVYKQLVFVTQLANGIFPDGL